MVKETDIAYQDGPLYAIWNPKKVGGCFEIRMDTSTYSVVLGEKRTLEEAKTFISRAKPYTDNLKKMYGIL